MYDVSAMPDDDTSLRFQRKQFEIYRRLSPSQRLEIGFELSDNTRDISLHALRSANPRLSEKDLHSQFLKRVMGWRLPLRILV
jgi:hypothetical protein